MADLPHGAASMLAQLPTRTVAPGFQERLQVAIGSPEPRTIAAPYYLTDLGVRRFPAPGIFYQAHLDLGGWDDVVEADDALDALLAAPVSELEGQLDALVLLTGDYDTAGAQPFLLFR